jgi:two-component system, chemotaxis family, chemotaxis protein CheY
VDHNKKRILIVEDNAGLAHVMSFNLRALGLDVAVAINGQVAWELAQAEAFDLIVTDHEMPRMTGIELCTRLRQLPEYAATPIIMVTARELELDLKNLRDELSIAAIFSKPYSPAKVKAKAEELLSFAAVTA